MQGSGSELPPARSPQEEGTGNDQSTVTDHVVGGDEYDDAVLVRLIIVITIAGHALNVEHRKLMTATLHFQAMRRPRMTKMIRSLRLSTD